jgi:hypothetical protein
MRLRTHWPTHAHNTPGTTATLYATPIDKEGKLRAATQEELLLLDIRIDEIRSVGKQVLDDDLKALVLNKQIGRLEFVITKGTVSRRKQDFFRFSRLDQPVLSRISCQSKKMRHLGR